MYNPILQVRDLQKKFPVYGPLGRLGKPKSFIHAVDHVSFHLYEGETYGLVGESGSGKTTIGRTILGLNESDGGQVIYQGVDLMSLTPGAFKRYRRDMQLVFQDPFSSLNPRKRVGTLLEEPLIIHKIGTSKERKEKVFEILDMVGLQPEHYFRFPHEFSGGQRQRIGLARAFITNPNIIICDEPVSALDVSIQAQILNLLMQLQKDLKLTMIFITHDISVVRHISNRIGVMYLGNIVEEALTDGLFSNPLHPYTKALFSAVPDFLKAPHQKKRERLKGETPPNTMDVTGCPFHHRCPLATDFCNTEKPRMHEVEPQHFVACHYV